MQKHIKNIFLSVLIISFGSSLTFAQAGDVDTEQDSCVILTNNLRFRSRDERTNNQVTDLQDFLISEGYMSGNTTGYFGQATAKAVKAFQSAKNLIPSGIVGVITRGKIKEMSCNSNGSSEGSTSDKNSSGVSYADIRLFVSNILNDASLNDSAKAQKLFNQMTASNVSTADIVFAFKDTGTKYTTSDINLFLSKRSQSLATTTSSTTSTNVATGVSTSSTATSISAPNWTGLTINFSQLVPGGEAVVVARNSGGSTLQSADISIVNTFYKISLDGGWITPNTNTDLDKFSVGIGFDGIGEFIKLRLLSQPAVSPYGKDGPIEFVIGVNLKSADKVNRTVQFKVTKSAGLTWGMISTSDKNSSGVSYADIRLFVSNILNDASLNDSAKAQKLFNQMTASNVSTADIVFAFKDTGTKYTTSDINLFLSKRS